MISFFFFLLNQIFVRLFGLKDVNKNLLNVTEHIYTNRVNTLAHEHAGACTDSSTNTQRVYLQ